MFRSTSIRLAVLYTAVFALSVVVLGAITLFTIRQAMVAQFETHIRSESAALAQEYNVEGFAGLIGAVRERDLMPGALDYGLRTATGQAVAGRLGATPAPMGWSVRVEPGSTRGERIRLYAMALNDGHVLLVGDNEDRIQALDAAVLRGFCWAFVGVVILGVAGGYALSRDVHRRLGAISTTAEAIIDGDLTRRVPVRGSDDDLDRLALTINRMLDRISALMDSLKQVSSDVAHDLRTPLTRLRQKLEAGLARPDERAEAMQGALGDLDAILDTFAALLRIAQIEGGAGRAAFRPCDLSAIGRTVVEAFAPSAEDQRQALTLEAGGQVFVEGDAELLTQMLVNLVENALRHAGGGAHIVVHVGRGEGGASIAVIDDGPGVPEAERARVVDRFYRLERSRTTPGSGLGLALVTAVARLHGGEVRLLDAKPGLEAKVLLPGA